MNELESKFLAELTESLEPYVTADFLADFAKALHGRVRRAIRVNFLRLAQIGPLATDNFSNLSRAEKLQAGLEFLENWSEFADFRGKWQIVPWSDDGFYVPLEAENMIAKCQAYKLGLYYLQESSAMLPANLLAAKRGEIIADYCAAPGGKSGKIASDLAGHGCLLSNDLALSRAKIMLRNLNELAVWHNALVNADLHDLAKRFKEHFSAVVLDVPCSGEGMVRRDRKALPARLEKDPKFFHQLQLELLLAAWQTVQAGGRLVYSTCTFNIEENEAVIYEFLQKQTSAEIISAPEFIRNASGLRAGFAYNGCEELKQSLRIFPQDKYGEGHFAVLLRKKGNVPTELPLWPDTKSAKAKLEIITIKAKADLKAKRKDKINEIISQKPTLNLLKQTLDYFVDHTCTKAVAEQYKQLFAKFPNFKLVGESVEWRLDLSNYEMDNLNTQNKGDDKLHVLSEGVWLGQCKILKNSCKFIPSHNWALLFGPNQCLYEVKTNVNDGLYERVLQGQSLSVNDVLPYLSSPAWPSQTSYALLTVGGFSACWLQLGVNFVKILYPKQWLNTI